MTAHLRLAELSAWIWPQLADHLWQSTLFALVAFAITMRLRRTRPDLLPAIWVTAAVKFAVPAALLAALASKTKDLIAPRVSLLAPIADFSPVLSRLVQPAKELALTTRHSELPCILTVIWIMGAAACLLRWRLQLRHVGSARPASLRDSAALASAKARLSFAGQVRLEIAENGSEPVVRGVLRPRLLLPAGISSHLSESELEAVLLHELVHLKRRDNLAGSLQRVLACIYWFHPLLWWMERRWMEDRERSCDHAVVRALGAPADYASGILKICRLSAVPAVAGLSGISSSNLKDRVELLMSYDLRVTSSARQRRLATLLAAIALLLPVCTGLLTRSAIAQTNTTAPAEIFRVEFFKPDGSPLKPLSPDLEMLRASLLRTDWTSRLVTPPSQPLPYAKWVSEDVAWIINETERAQFLELRSRPELERFVGAFWQRRDPTPNTAANEFQEEHYRRIAWANERFGSDRPGWKTDRGRVYIQFGPPDEIEAHPSPAPGWEIWTYPLSETTPGRFRITFRLTR